MKRSFSIKQGDIIDVIAPGYYPKETFLATTRKYLEDAGFTGRMMFDETFPEDKKPLYYLDYKAKAEFLLKALKNTDSQIIWIVCGGYGSARILDILEQHDLSDLPPKLLIGFSDVTALLLYFNQKYNHIVLHAEGLGCMAHDDPAKLDKILLTDILMGKKSNMSYQIEPLNQVFKADIESSITGGNLALVASSIGTYWQIDTKDKIIFLEDIGERAYRIDRMLLQMKQTGLFNKAKAVLFGDFIGTKEPNGNDYSQEILQFFASNIDIPVFKVNDIGHKDVNYPLAFGTKSSIKCLNNQFNLGVEFYE